MSKFDFKLLDCTLRDGGYINDWNWGFEKARDIIGFLVKAGVDIIEVGFLRNVAEYNPDVAVCNNIEELNRLLPEEESYIGDTLFSAMIMQSNYNIEKLSRYSGKGIQLIRVTAHDYDIAEGIEFAKKVMEKGYKVSINPINIMGYRDEQILDLVYRVNEIMPYQFSIVDTFGSMKRRDLDRIVSLIDNNLVGDIRLSLHLHENMSLACCLAQSFVDKHLQRPISVDGSLMGMGRVPGNLPIELFADYLNEYMGYIYNIDSLMDAIQDYIEPLKGENAWGYTPAYFLSARFNLHRNYAEYFLKKGDLTNRDINHILSRLDKSKSTAFDEHYADELYQAYMNNRIDDSDARRRLKEYLKGKRVLAIAPGASINAEKNKILNFIESEKPVVISVNFTTNSFPVMYTFCSNNKRYQTMVSHIGKVIITSNIEDERADFQVDYNKIAGAFDQGCNSLIMLLNLLKDMQVEEVILAGADGYKAGGANYYQSNMRSYAEHGHEFNVAVRHAIKKVGLNVLYLTDSEYRENLWELL